jgi:hypothetical protein
MEVVHFRHAASLAQVFSHRLGINLFRHGIHREVNRVVKPTNTTPTSYMTLSATPTAMALL